MKFNYRDIVDTDLWQISVEVTDKRGYYVKYDVTDVNDDDDDDDDDNDDDVVC